MGIQGLLPLLKDIQRKVSVRDFKGQTVGIDAYCWLHKGAYGCAQDLVEGKDSTVYLNYVLRRINMLQNFDIKPILVFDGGYLPAKASKEEERRRSRDENLKKGKAFLRAGNKSQAIDCFQKCVNITPMMATNVIKACRKKGVLCIVAPYEADAQLAYLQKEGITDLTITEDSDLLVYGCKKVIFKLTADGEGVLIDLADLNKVRSLSFSSFTFEKFRHMCMLSGCDYLPSVKGMGLVKSYKILLKSSDVYRAIKALKMGNSVKVPVDYEEKFRKADAVFKYQAVFDHRKGMIVPLNVVQETDCVSQDDLKFAGPPLTDEKARAIALGNLDPISGEELAQFQEFVDEGIKEMEAVSDKKESSSAFTFVSHKKESILPRKLHTVKARRNDALDLDDAQSIACQYLKSPATQHSDTGEVRPNSPNKHSPEFKRLTLNPFKRKPAAEDKDISKNNLSKYFSTGFSFSPRFKRQTIEPQISCSKVTEQLSENTKKQNCTRSQNLDILDLNKLHNEVLPVSLRYKVEESSCNFGKVNNVVITGKDEELPASPLADSNRTVCSPVKDHMTYHHLEDDANNDIRNEIKGPLHENLYGQRKGIHVEGIMEDLTQHVSGEDKLVSYINKENDVCQSKCQMGLFSKTRLNNRGRTYISDLLQKFSRSSENTCPNQEGSVYDKIGNKNNTDVKVKEKDGDVESEVQTKDSLTGLTSYNSWTDQEFLTTAYSEKKTIANTFETNNIKAQEKMNLIAKSVQPSAKIGRCKALGLSRKRKAIGTEGGCSKKANTMQLTLQHFAFKKKSLEW